jgi:hypothetical protein
MGCWNETCAVSKLAIHCGEAVRLLPIVLNPYHVEELVGWQGGKPIVVKGQSGCYIGDLWTPLCYPIRGTYNDYGSIEDVPETTDRDKAEVKQFLDAFKTHCVSLDVGENECHDVAIKNFELGEILEALQEGRAYCDYHSGLPQYPNLVVPIGWMMIKESIWQDLLKTDILKSGECWCHRCKDKNEPDHTTLKGIRAALAKQVNKVLSETKMEKLMKKAQDKTITAEETKIMLDALTISLGSLGSRDHYRSPVWHMSPIGQPEFTEGLLDVASEMSYIHNLMSLLRINYAPTTGSGGQSDNRKLWKLVFASWTKTFAAELKKQEAARIKDDRRYKASLKLMCKKTT